MKLFVSISFLLFLFVNNIYGQRTYTPEFSDPLLDKFRWRHYPELSGRNFSAFCEGKNGTMWFGIETGVMSYDGYQWTEHNRNKESEELVVREMAFVGDTLYYAGNGIRTFINGNWSAPKFLLRKEQEIPIMASNGKFLITDIEVSDDVVIAAATSGIYIRKDGIDHFYTKAGIKRRQETIFTDLKFHVLNNFGNGFKMRCSDILDCGNNTFYAFVNGPNLKRHFKFRLTDNKDDPLQVIEEHLFGDVDIGGPVGSIQRPNGEIWVASLSFNSGLNILKNNEWKVLKFIELLNATEISSDIINLSDNTTIITSLSAIYRYHNHQWSKITTPNIPFESMELFAFLTKSGDLWLGDKKGEVYKIDYNNKHYTTYTNLNYQFTHTDRSLWFLSNDNKIVYKKDDSWYYYDTTDGLPDAPQTLYLTTNGTIWCGGSHNQVAATAYLKDNKWIKQCFDSLSWSINYNAVIEGEDGGVWFGGASHPKAIFGQKGGMVKIELNHKTTKTTPYYNLRPEFQSFEILNNNTLYAGTEFGLITFDKGKATTVFGTNKNYGRIKKTATSALWVATLGDGILQFDGNEVKKNFTVKNGLNSNVIFDIYPTNDTSVWAATNKGYSYYNGHFWINDIYPDELNIGNESGRLSGDKENIWISKFPLKWTRRIYEGVNYVDAIGEMFSVMYRQDSSPPETQITFYSQIVDASGNTNIEWDGIDYMHHTPKEKLSYSYRLNNQEWSVPNPSKNVNLTGLKSNNYVFEVRAHDKDMNFDPTPAQLSFTVMPPVWKQSWFIVLILSFVMIVLILIARIIKHNQNLFIANKEIANKNVELKKTNIEFEEASATKNKFFSIIAHDIKNPFNAILGFSELLKDNTNELADSQKIEIATQIYDSSNKLYQLLENLLHWSRSQRNVIDFEPSNIELNSLFHNIVALMQGLAETKNIKVSVKLLDKDWVVKADRQMLETIVRNLISNAIKFTKNGGSIQISAEKQNKALVDITVNDNAFVKVLVSDNGVGMSSKTKNGLFKIDSNQSTPGTENEKGTGLGLILVKEFVSRHGGEIGVESEVGKGSTFYFTLPLGENK